MDLAFSILILVTVVVAGVLTGLELAVSAIVNPVLAGLGESAYLRGRSHGAGFMGRAMPVVYISLLILAVTSLVLGWGSGGTWYLAAAVGIYLVIMVGTVSYLVPINSRAARWDPDQPPSGWRAALRRWDIGHAIRITLLLIAFVLLVVGSHQ